jgi:hypothetical protein
MKVGLIYQPCGLGDILFMQKLGYHIHDQGYKVYWPVIHEFKWLNDYIDDFEFVSWEDEGNPTSTIPDAPQFPFKEEYVLGAPNKITDELYFLQGCGYHEQMKGKYERAGVDWQDYGDYIKFNRNKEKEDELFYNVLGLNDDEEYVYVNRIYFPRADGFKDNISTDPKDYDGKRVIENKIIPGYTLFDWCKVLEKASALFMMETSINYLLESPQMYDTIAKKPLYLWNRWNHFNDVSYLHKLPWKYQYL